MTWFGGWGAKLWAALALVGAVLAALVFRAGQRGATDRAAARAAESEQQGRARADAAAAEAGRTGALDRLDNGRF